MDRIRFPQWTGQHRHGQRRQPASSTPACRRPSAHRSSPADPAQRSDHCPENEPEAAINKSSGELITPKKLNKKICE